MRRKLFSVMCIVLTAGMLVGCGAVVKENGENNSEKKSEYFEPSGTEEITESGIPDKSSEDIQQSGKKEKDNKNPVLGFLAKSEYADLKESEGFEFESNGDGTCTLVKIGTCKDKDIVIPKRSPAGDTVTMIGEYAFYDTDDIDKIIFVDKTMKINKKAFQACEFEELIIDGCNLIIDKNAFEYCDDISVISISNSVIEIGEYAFYDSGSDTEVTFLNSSITIDDKAFQASNIKTLDISKCTMEIGDNVFAYCDDLSTVSVSECEVTVGEYAFYDSGKKMEVLFSDSFVTLEDKVFQASAIVSLEVRDCPEFIVGDNAFAYCDKLETATIGEGTVEIGEYAFYDCTDFTTLSIAENSAKENEITIDDKAFQTSGLVSVVIGAGTVKVGRNAFSYCEDLESVVFQGKTLKVKDNAFYDCPAELVIMFNGKQYNKENIGDV